MKQGVKTSEEILLSAILVVGKVQPSNNGVTDSEKDDNSDVEAIKVINNTRKQVENDTFITAH